MMPSLSFGEMGEFPLIERLKTIASRTSSQVVEGMGDDAAIWSPKPGFELCLSCDAQVEGRHFLPLQNASEEQWQKVGRRCAMVNLSDLAAMGAQPRFALVSLGLPSTIPVAGIEALYRGFVGALDEAEAVLLGGNITSVDEGPFWLDVTVGGEVPRGKGLLRKGTQTGDRIGVTGFPGSSAAGLQLLLQEKEVPDILLPLVTAYESPQARWKEARAMAPWIHSLTDTSDGLWMDLQSLLQAGQKAVLQESILPLSDALQHWARAEGVPPWTCLSEPSDDYELLFTAPDEHHVQIEQALAELHCPIHWLGRVEERAASEASLWLELKNQERIEMEGRGWEHR